MQNVGRFCITSEILSQHYLHNIYTTFITFAKFIVVAKMIFEMYTWFMFEICILYCIRNLSRTLFSECVHNIILEIYI
jgi:hypothetical protein